MSFSIHNDSDHITFWYVIPLALAWPIQTLKESLNVILFLIGKIVFVNFVIHYQILRSWVVEGMMYTKLVWIWLCSSLFKFIRKVTYVACCEQENLWALFWECKIELQGDRLIGENFNFIATFVIVIDNLRMHCGSLIFDWHFLCLWQNYMLDEYFQVKMMFLSIYFNVGLYLLFEFLYFTKYSWKFNNEHISCTYLKYSPLPNSIYSVKIYFKIVF